MGSSKKRRSDSINFKPLGFTEPFIVTPLHGFFSSFPIAQGNRGAAFENLINSTNESYENRELAVINKRSTPVKVTRSKGTKVLAGFFEAKSTVYYDGIYRGRTVFFEAKSIQELDRFDLKKVEDH